MLMLISLCISIIATSFSGRFIDFLTTADDTNELWVYIATFILIWSSDVVLGYLASIIGAKLNISIMYDINFSALEKAKRLPYSYYYKIDPTYLNQRIHNDSSKLASFFLGSVLQICLNIIRIVVIFAMILYISIELSFVLVIFLIAYTCLYSLFRKIIYKINLEFSETKDKFFGKMNKQLTNIKTIKINNWYKKLEEKLRQEFSIVYEAAIKHTKLNNVYGNLDKVLSYAASIFIFIFMGIRVINKQATVGEFTVINTYFMTVMNGFRQFFSFGKSYQEANVAYDRIMQIFETEPECCGSIELTAIQDVNISHLSYSYTHRSEDDVVRNFNLTMLPGNIYVIKGRNGSGKSTIINSLLRLLQDYRGEIRINGQDIATLNIESLREKKIAVVEQEAGYLFDSVYEYLHIDCSNEALIEEYVDRFEIGYLYNREFVKESNLSGGERQKVCLAHAFSKNPQLIILDEPSSSLDDHSVENLCNILREEKRDKIILIITHDDRLAQVADYQYELESHGNISGQEQLNSAT